MIGRLFQLIDDIGLSTTEHHLIYALLTVAP